MTAKLVIGLDGHNSGERALAYAQKVAGQIGDCELLIVYVIEWSPYSFQTPQENAERHKRREEEISTATERVVAPAIEKLEKQGLNVKGIVRHGDVAETLISISDKEKADQIIVCRASEGGITQRIFGSATSNLVMGANVPVTVVG